MIETRQRAEVIDALRKGEALGAQELHARLRAKKSRTGLATVYRTLKLLAAQGVLDVIREESRGTRYRLCSNDHHHHLLCEICGKVTEIPECDIGQWASRVARSHGFRLTEHRADLIGRCASCRRTKKR